MNKVKITTTVHIIGTVGLPACYGGFETLVENLVQEDSNQNFLVYCSSKHYENRQEFYNGAKLVYIPLSANGAQSVFYDIFSMIKSIFNKPDVVLILGVSGCVFLPLFRFLSNSKVITNIDGLEWKRDKWGTLARKFLKLSEKIAVRNSDVIISDNKAIADYVMEEYSVESEVIAYGGDHALHCKLELRDDDYAFALCRIEPENNVELILEAFSRTTQKIKFVGNWKNSQFGMDMVKRFSIFDNIELIDPIYDQSTLHKLRSSCSFYVHGHSAGGTNPSLVEMMHFEKNIFCFNCSYNIETTKNSTLYFSTVDELVDLINTENELDLGVTLRKIAESDYTWLNIRNKYYDLFSKGK